ncbi:MAG TPA: fibronectin type III domain-containing protein, partial [Candidatus Nanopelagicales bacterium]|nr:fibronectin type III domain-containing protein [Candidatus Nanopelagicales bacterium]
GNVVGPTIFGHNGGADTISVAAVPYDNPHEVEPYSALGPVTHYFGAVRGSGKPASPLAAPAVISAPTIAATDGTATTFFGDRSGGFWRFYGTSAAAPNAAAVVALVRALNPSLSPAQVRAVLRSTARRVGSSRPTAVGSGLVDARRAVGYVAAPVAPRLTRTKAKTGAVRIRFTPTPQPRIAPTVAYAAKCASSDGGAARRVRRAGTSTAAITVGGLTRGKHYRCKVRADTALASGRYSPKGAVVVPRGVPGRPRHVVVEPRPAAVKVTFRAPTNTGGRHITTYAARCTPVDGGRARARTGPTTELRVRHLLAGVGYRCAVTATNSRGTGPSSAMSRRVVPLR